MSSTAIRLVACSAALVLAGACKRAPTPAPVPAPAVVDNSGNEDALARARRDSIARAEAARADSIARAEADRRAREAAAAAEMATLVQTVYFEYDADALTSATISQLEARAPILRANGGIRIRVSGHADDRGSDEYNLALGQRRAAAVKRFLVARGIQDGRIDTESFGEQRPVCQSGEESCWAKNRRAEFTIVAGAVAVAEKQ